MTDKRKLKILRKQMHNIRKEVDKLEEAEWKREHDALVGRYFKYHNSFGSGDKWWLYMSVTAIQGHSIKGFQFERASNGEFRVKPDDIRFSFSLAEGWIEIDLAEYKEAWNELIVNMCYKYNKAMQKSDTSA